MFELPSSTKKNYRITRKEVQELQRSLPYQGRRKEIA